MNHNKMLGRLGGMACQYNNLASVYLARGDQETARRYWGLARGLYAKIGMPHMVAKMQGRIDGLPNE